MNSRKLLLIPEVIVLIIFFVVHSGLSQTKKQEIIFFSGRITKISGDYKSIVVDEMNILIDSDTKLLDEKGKNLRIHDLKPTLLVRIEGIRHPNGFLAKKIIVKKNVEV